MGACRGCDRVRIDLHEDPIVMRRLAGWIAIILLMAGGCAAPTESGPATLKAYLSAEPASLNYVTQGDFNTEIVAKLVGDTLVDFSSELDLVPRLASSWERSSACRPTRRSASCPSFKMMIVGIPVTPNCAAIA